MRLQGLNTKKGFDVKVAAEISKITGLDFKTAPNKVTVVFVVATCVDRLLLSLRRWLLMMLW